MASHTIGHTQALHEIDIICLPEARRICASWTGHPCFDLLRTALHSATTVSMPFVRRPSFPNNNFSYPLTHVVFNTDSMPISSPEVHLRRTNLDILINTIHDKLFHNDNQHHSSVLNYNCKNGACQQAHMSGLWINRKRLEIPGNPKTYADWLMRISEWVSKASDASAFFTVAAWLAFKPLYRTHLIIYLYKLSTL